MSCLKNSKEAKVTRFKSMRDVLKRKKNAKAQGQEQGRLGRVLNAKQRNLYLILDLIENY